MDRCCRTKNKNVVSNDFKLREKIVHKNNNNGFWKTECRALIIRSSGGIFKLKQIKAQINSVYVFHTCK